MTNPDAQAFPNNAGNYGLTKREYFACHIAAGLSACPNLTNEESAEFAVFQADLLIAELNKEGKP